MFKKNLNDILGGFNKIVKDLNNYIERENEQILNTQDKISNLQLENIERIDNAEKAVVVRDNIAGILGE